MLNTVTCCDVVPCYLTFSGPAFFSAVLPRSGDHGLVAPLHSWAAEALVNRRTFVLPVDFVPLPSRTLRTFLCMSDSALRGRNRRICRMRRYVFLGWCTAHAHRRTPAAGAIPVVPHPALRAFLRYGERLAQRSIPLLKPTMLRWVIRPIPLRYLSGCSALYRRGWRKKISKEEESEEEREENISEEEMKK